MRVRARASRSRAATRRQGIANHTTHWWCLQHNNILLLCTCANGTCSLLCCSLLSCRPRIRTSRCSQRYRPPARGRSIHEDRSLWGLSQQASLLLTMSVRCCWDLPPAWAQAPSSFARVTRGPSCTHIPQSLPAKAVGLWPVCRACAGVVLGKAGRRSSREGERSVPTIYTCMHARVCVACREAADACTCTA